MALLCAVLLAPPAFAEPDTLGLGTGRNGVLTVNAANTIVNTYTRLTATANAGATSVTVTSTAGFAAGDLVMVYQSTGLTAVAIGSQTAIDLSTAQVGRWQFARVLSLTGTTRLNFVAGTTLTQAFTVGTTANLAAQVLRVPEYQSVTVNAGASIVAAPWDGQVGGLVVFLSQGAVNNAGAISANGMGFRGGLYRNGNGDGCTGINQAYPGGTSKGEGVVPGNFSIAGVPPTNTTGYGNVGNAGGGGICHNSGGGGGGAAGAGGRGGRTWSGDNGGGASASRDVGGLGGVPMNFSAVDHLLFGGGGGAGHS
ncbi:cell envelope biogenesis protein OmpA, partial [Corallococcus aberystwythensis]